MKQELEVEAPKSRTEVVKAVKGKVAVLAEALQPYVFEPLKVRKLSIAFESKMEVCAVFEPGEQWFIFKSSDSEM